MTTHLFPFSPCTGQTETTSFIPSTMTTSSAPTPLRTTRTLAPDACPDAVTICLAPPSPPVVSSGTIQKSLMGARFAQLSIRVKLVDPPLDEGSIVSSRMPDNPVALPFPFAVRLESAEGWDPISRRMIWQSPDSEPMKTSPASRYEMHEAGETWGCNISMCRPGLFEDVQCQPKKL